MYKTLLTLIASALFSVAAVAGEQSSFKALDQNGDDAISAEEAAQSERLTETWTTVDANADSVVDRVEFSAFEAMETKEQKGQ